MNVTMRLYRKPSGIYYVEYGRGNAKSLKTRNTAKAQTVFNKLKRAAEKNHVARLEGHSLTRLGEFVRDYLEHAVLHKSPQTVRADRLALNKLIAEYGEQKLLTQLTSKDLGKFLKKLLDTGIKKTSLAVYYRHLKAAFSQAVSWNQLRQNPFKEIKEPRGRKQSPRYLSPEELERIFAAETHPALARLWRFYLWSGVRRREALALTWANIDRRHELIFLPETKNGQVAAVDITPQIAAILDEMPGQVGRLWPWTPDYVSHRFARICRQAGVKARLHDLRHSYASYLLMAGVQLKVVKELLHHQDIKATQIYAHLDRAHLRAAQEKLSFRKDAAE
jgi:site-specific recombinase XerD